MNTSEYAGKVWATTLTVSPILYIPMLFIAETVLGNVIINEVDEGIELLDPTLLERIVNGIGGTILIFFLGIIFSFLPAVLYLLSAKGLRLLKLSIYIKKALLLFSTFLTLFSAAVILDNSLTNIIFVTFPYLLIGTLSTFLYPWQPEKD
jgi:hypothetical protein